MLDFQFAFDIRAQREFIRNVHPGKGEREEYIPTAGGFDTGESFALIGVFITTLATEAESLIIAPAPAGVLRQPEI